MEVDGEEVAVTKTFGLFLSLPSELELQVLFHLSVTELTQVSLVCRVLKDLSESNTLWRRLSKKRWNIRHSKRWNLNWKRYYKQQSLLWKPGNIKWEQLTRVPDSPKPRSAHTGCVIGNNIYYVGGQNRGNETRIDEIIRFNVDTQEFTEFTNGKGIQGDRVPKFARHQAQAIGHCIYCFGGFDLKEFYPLAVFDTQSFTWKYPQVSGVLPRPRSNHASAVLGNRFYIFGGSIGDDINKYETINDFSYFDTETYTWHRVDSRNTPGPRVGHKMIAVRDKIVLFGGGLWSSEDGWIAQYNDTFIYHLDGNYWTEVKNKPDIKPPISTYPYIFKLGLNVVIFGGASYEANTVTEEMWRFNVLTQEWSAVIVESEEGNPSARSMGASDVVGNEVYIWGGYCGGVLPGHSDFYKLVLNIAAKDMDDPW